MSVFKVEKSPFYQYDFKIAGKRYRGTTEERSKGRAQSVEAMERSKVLSGKVNPRSRKSPTLAQIAPLFLAEQEAAYAAGNKAYQTLRNLKHGWDQLRDTPVAAMRIDTITKGTASTLKFRGGAWEARGCQSTLSRMLHWAADNGYLAAAPRIGRTKAANRELRISKQIETLLLKNMDDDCADVFQIMLDCGMRPEEVLKMRWENVAWDRDEIFIPRGKTPESRRFVPMSSRMRQLLTVRRNNGSLWVFPTPTFIDGATQRRALDMFATGASIRAVSLELEISWPLAKAISEGKQPKRKSSVDHRVNVSKQWESAREASCLPEKYVLYCARHEFATSFLEHGGDLATLKKIMGHTSISTTEKYLHMIVDQRARQIIDRRNNGTKLEIVERLA
ncbi:tyrosine-type recombinase/integrase [Telmatobacter bradus]|uniref:tyrosine-type recombinase/integrase n=1 Tax=Telmatobacter bradus TaxID=474953 RepID=UPI003B42CAF2